MGLGRAGSGGGDVMYDVVDRGRGEVSLVRDGYEIAHTQDGSIKHDRYYTEKDSDAVWQFTRKYGDTLLDSVAKWNRAIEKRGYVN